MISPRALTAGFSRRSRCSSQPGSELDFYAAALAAGSARPGARQLPETFDVVGGLLAIIEDDDLERAADRARATLALYIGGMGAPGFNFRCEVFARMGYEAEARKIQGLYLAGDQKSAIAALRAVARVLGCSGARRWPGPRDRSGPVQVSILFQHPGQLRGGLPVLGVGLAASSASIPASRETRGLVAGLSPS